MTIKFYATEISPPCRAVWMLLETLGLEYEWKETFPPKGDAKTPEYLKMNPLHTIPCLVDDDMVIVESRVILKYLAKKYGKEGCNLYPEDLKLQTMVDQRLFFDLSNIGGLFVKIRHPVLYHNKMYDPALLDTLHENLQIAEDYIKPTGFIAGTPDLSIADFCFLANYTSIKASGLAKENGFPGLDAYVTRCSKLVKNYEKHNKNGADMLGEIFKDIVSKINN